MPTSSRRSRPTPFPACHKPSLGGRWPSEARSDEGRPFWLMSAVGCICKLRFPSSVTLTRDSFPQGKPLARSFAECHPGKFRFRRGRCPHRPAVPARCLFRRAMIYAAFGGCVGRAYIRAAVRSCCIPARMYPRPAYGRTACRYSIPHKAVMNRKNGFFTAFRAGGNSCAGPARCSCSTRRRTFPGCGSRPPHRCSSVRLSSVRR